jgi:inner membrane protein
MDPLTHTLVGANLAATPLAGKTRLAAAAVVIGANLPDVDSILYFTGHEDLALGFRRGWTHGVLALAVLPLLLTGILLVYDRLRPHAVRRAHAGWLLLLSAIAILTHPFLDWLNNYGMRWLMPFRGTWSYGDSVFIMDPWLWLVLGGGWLVGRRPTRTLIVLWAFFTIAIARVVWQRSPDYLIVIGIVAVVLLIALLWRTRRSLAVVALAIAFMYIGARLVIHEATESAVRRELPAATAVMAAPHPIDPTRWEVVARVGDEYRYGRYSWRRRALMLTDHHIPVARDSPEWEIARRDPSIRGFMTWVRFPWYEIERTATETRVLVHDARYLTRRRPGGGFGGVVVVIPR